MPQRYLRTGSSKIRCIVEGSGPALVLLHASPLNADVFAPHIEAARDRFTVIALDLPGLGFSDPIARDQPDCADYARHIVACLRENGIEQATIWAVATGAYIAQEIARLFPDFATHTIVESFTAVREEEKPDIFASYFCDLTPRWDGGHLATLFQFNRDVLLFYPWYRHTAAARTGNDVPPAETVHRLSAMHAFALERWDIAYRAAFRYSSPHSLAGITAPVTVIRSDASIFKHHVDRLTGYGDNVDILELGADRGANIEAIVAHAAARCSAGPVALRSGVEDHRSGFLRLRSGAQLHVIDYAPAWPNAGPPLVLLHDLPGDHTCLRHLLGGGLDRRVIVPDLPGYGGSAAIGSGDDWYAVALAALRDLIDDIGEPVSLVAFGAAAALASDLHGDAVAACHLVRPDLMTENSVRLSYPSMAPAAYGEHLLRCWGFLRDEYLYSRPDQPSAATRVDRLDELDLAMLQRRHTAWMMRGDRLRDDLRAIVARAPVLDMGDNRLRIYDSPECARQILPADPGDRLAFIVAQEERAASAGAELNRWEPQSP